VPAKKITVDNPTTIGLHAAVHISTGPTPGLLIPAHIKHSHACIQL